MVVLTYPASTTDESDLIRIKSDIFVNSAKKVCTTHINESVLKFVNTAVLLSLSIVPNGGFNRLMLTHTLQKQVFIFKHCLVFI